MGLSNSRTGATADPQKLVEDAIRDHPVVVFSKSYCPYCVKGKNAIKSATRNVDNYPGAKVFELDKMESGAAVQNYLAKKTGRRTVPNVFVAGKSIGGGDETAKLHSRGKLTDMIRNAVAASAAPSVADDVSKIVEDAIAKHPVVVFSKSYCPYCKMAKAAIKKAGAGVDGFSGAQVFEMDNSDNGAAMQAYLQKKTGRRTVPNVFIGGKNIGGGDETVAYAQSDELVNMIRAAVAGSAPSDMKDIVESAISKHPVVIFGKDYCPYCRKAKQAIKTAGAKVAGFEGAKVFEMNLLENGAEMQAYLAEKTGRRTVPNVFIGGKAVGGGDDVVGYLEAGVLSQMLTAAVNKHSTNSVSTAAPAAETVDTETALFGAGCFWGAELAFQRVRGVVRTEVGYANGHMEKVTYEQVCSGTTGHAEVVKVWFRPAEVSFEHLIAVWEKRHDVTSANRQGNDAGTQYRSALYYTNEAQKKTVEKWLEEANRRYEGKTVYTDVGTVNNYCPAEEYHQQYLEKGGQSAAKGSSEQISCYGIPSNL